MDIDSIELEHKASTSFSSSGKSFLSTTDYFKTGSCTKAECWSAFMSDVSGIMSDLLGRVVNGLHQFGRFNNPGFYWSVCA